MAAVDQRIIAVEEETDVEPVRFVLKWSMKNFTSIRETTADMYSTGITMAELGISMEENYRGRWRINVKPCYSLTENDVHVNYVSVYLRVTDEDLKSTSYTGERQLRCHFRTRVTSGKLMDVPVFAVGFADYTFTSKICSSGYAKVATHQDLFGLGGEVGRLKDDCLNIAIDVLFFGEVGTNRVVNIPPSVAQRQRDFIGRQFKQLGTADDFLLISNDKKEFPVDRFVLVAHSPTFAAMLNSKEKQTSRCVMEDVDGESVEILLDYVYGCETGKINGDNVEKVVVMADKYELMDLRAVAEMTLAQNITVDNAVDMLVLARQRNLGTLKEVVLKFIRKNTEAVLIQSNGI